MTIGSTILLDDRVSRNEDMTGPGISGYVFGEFCRCLCSMVKTFDINIKPHNMYSRMNPKVIWRRRRRI